jgi:hypothetical protein
MMSHSNVLALLQLVSVVPDAVPVSVVVPPSTGDVAVQALAHCACSHWVPADDADEHAALMFELHAKMHAVSLQSHAATQDNNVAQALSTALSCDAHLLSSHE